LNCSKSDFLLNPNVNKAYAKYKSDYTDDLIPNATLNQMVDHLQRVPDANEWGAWIQLHPYGGAFDAIGDNDTPYQARRGTTMLMQYSIALEEGELPSSPSYAWLNELEDIIEPVANGKHYQNFPDLDLQNYGVAYYGSRNYERLQSIKEVYDPNNLFNNQQSVQPVPTASPTTSPSYSAEPTINSEATDDVNISITALVASFIIAGILIVLCIVMCVPYPDRCTTSGKERRMRDALPNTDEIEYHIPGIEIAASPSGKERRMRDALPSTDEIEYHISGIEIAASPSPNAVLPVSPLSPASFAI
jgi:hypothetical protein